MEILEQLEVSLWLIAPSVGLGLVFIAGAFMVVIVGRRYVRRWQFDDSARGRILQAWAEVEKHVAAGDDTHLRMAIIKADSVLDMALLAKMFPGRSLNDRLNFAIHKYRNLRRVRWAHGLRNGLAHDPLKKLGRRDGTAAIGAFKSALIELGAL